MTAISTTTEPAAAPAATRDPFAVFQSTKVFSALNGIRALCAIGVIKIHAKWHTPSLPFLNHGDFGVDMFFTISGFLIVTLLLRERAQSGTISLRQFYARRTLRIFPVYYAMILAVLLAFLVVAPWRPNGLRFYLPVAAVLLTYTTDVIPRAGLGIFFHCWSLAMEEQFYLVWPAMEKLLSRAGKWILLAVGVVFSQLVNFRVFDGVIARLYGDPDAPKMPIYLITFTPILFGVVLAHMLHHGRSFRLLYAVVGRRFTPVVILVAVVWLVNGLPERTHGLPKLTLHLLLMLGLASVVIREDNIMRRVLTNPALAHLGITSYGIYLYHVPVLDLLTRVTHGRASPAAAFVVVAVITVGVAELSFRYFESRFLRLRSRFR